MEIGVRRVVRVSLRGLIGIGAHVRSCRGSSSGKGRRIGRRAIVEAGVVAVLSMMGIDLRRVNGFIQIMGGKVYISLAVDMNVATHNAIGSRISVVDIRMARSSGRVRWSQIPAG